jgi:hypothetical protein
MSETQNETQNFLNITNAIAILEKSNNKEKFCIIRQDDFDDECDIMNVCAVYYSTKQNEVILFCSLDDEVKIDHSNSLSIDQVLKRLRAIAREHVNVNVKQILCFDLFLYERNLMYHTDKLITV